MSEHIPFPQGWIEQLTPLLGSKLPHFLESYHEPARRGLRMRKGILPPGDVLSPVPWAEQGFYLPEESLAGALPAHEAGAYYIQEPSAMTAAAALHPQPGDKVLDLCAAPGGKSTQLGAYLQGQGLLISNEPVPSRAQILSRNMERMGIPNAVVISALPEDLSPRWPDFFDKILVDAPCSGEGMFRKHPEARKEWNAASPAGCAKRQEQILSHAARMLRPGGFLAYSTCTFNPTENEGVIEHFLASQPEFSLVPFALPGLPESQGMLRIWPHEVAGEGHFVALLHKAEGKAASLPGRKNPDRTYTRPASKDILPAMDFLKAHIACPVQPNGLFAGHLVQLPEGLPPLDGLKVLRLGLQIGEQKGKIFLPDHALALACPSLRPLPVSQTEARDYQQGQTLPVSEALRGFYTPTYLGLSLGWGKASGGQLKNHYPKGLRRQGAAGDLD